MILCIGKRRKWLIQRPEREMFGQEREMNANMAARGECDLSLPLGYSKATNSLTLAKIQTQLWPNEVWSYFDERRPLTFNSLLNKWNHSGTCTSNSTSQFDLLSYVATHAWVLLPSTTQKFLSSVKKWCYWQYSKNHFTFDISLFCIFIWFYFLFSWLKLLFYLIFFFDLLFFLFFFFNSFLIRSLFLSFFHVKLLFLSLQIAYGFFQSPTWALINLFTINQFISFGNFRHGTPETLVSNFSWKD